MQNALHLRWSRLWMRFAGNQFSGRWATRMAGMGWPRSFGRIPLTYMNRRGYTAPSAAVNHPLYRAGNHVFVGDRVNILQRGGGGPVEFQDDVHIYDDTYIQTGQQGSVHIGAKTHIQPRCYFSAFLSPIRIGRSVEVASSCAFFPHNHQTDAGRLISDQPLWSKGGITIGDGAWLGFGVIVLDGVTIGEGAVIGAGSIVTKDIPANAISVGSPARVVKMRQPAEEKSTTTTR